MLIVNPTFGLAAAAGPTVALKPINWATDAIAGMKAKLGAFRNVDNIEFHAKNSASQAAPKELIQAIAGKYRAALLALGD